MKLSQIYTRVLSYFGLLLAYFCAAKRLLVASQEALIQCSMVWLKSVLIPQHMGAGCREDSVMGRVTVLRSPAASCRDDQLWHSSGLWCVPV